jgi:hypothetical protein
MKDRYRERPTALRKDTVEQQKNGVCRSDLYLTPQVVFFDESQRAEIFPPIQIRGPIEGIPRDSTSD